VSDTLFHTVPGAPNPIAPFSHAVEADGWVFVTGQMPIDPAREGPLPRDIESQTRAVMTNLRTVLGGLGLDFSHVVSARCFLTRFKKEYAPFNAVYSSYFAPGRLPARTCIGVTDLALGARVEVDFVARRPGLRAL
jgi:2-iminobutanoate/2-iminopropanoate deaminase